MKDIFQRWAKLNSNEQCKRRCFCLSANKFCLTIEMCFTKKENYFITKWSIFDLIVARKLFYIAICFNLFIILFLFVYCSFYFRTTTVQCIQLTSLDVNKTALPQSFTKTKKIKQNTQIHDSVTNHPLMVLYECNGDDFKNHCTNCHRKTDFVFSIQNKYRNNQSIKFIQNQTKTLPSNKSNPTKARCQTSGQKDV